MGERTPFLSQLHTNGFCVVPGLVPARELGVIAGAYDRAFASATVPDLHIGRSGTNVRLAVLLNHGGEFDALFVLEPVLAACSDVIGAHFKLSSFHGRTVLPGAASQSLHVDVRPDQDAWPLLGFIVMVDAFTADNGATRFVPGSHRREKPGAAREGNDRPADGRAVLACGQAGSVIIYSGSAWHGFSANRSAVPRRSIQGAYVPRSAAGAVEWAPSLRPQALRRLSATARHVLAID